MSTLSTLVMTAGSFKNGIGVIDIGLDPLDRSKIG